MQKCIGVWWSRELNPIGTWSGLAGCFWCPLPYARLSLEKDSYNHLTMHNVYKLYLTVFLADAAAAIVQLPSWPITRYRSKIHFKQVKILPSLESRILHVTTQATHPFTQIPLLSHHMTFLWIPIIFFLFSFASRVFPPCSIFAVTTTRQMLRFQRTISEWSGGRWIYMYISVVIYQLDSSSIYLSMQIRE